MLPTTCTSWIRKLKEKCRTYNTYRFWLPNFLKNKIFLYKKQDGMLEDERAKTRMENS